MKLPFGFKETWTSNGNSILKIKTHGDGELHQLASKSPLKHSQILPKSTSEAVLEHFGDPLGAKVAQEPQQDLKNSENIGFRGRLGGPKWTKNLYKVLFENGRHSMIILKRLFGRSWKGLRFENHPKMRGPRVVFRPRC